MDKDDKHDNLYCTDIFSILTYQVFFDTSSHWINLGKLMCFARTSQEKLYSAEWLLSETYKGK